jgi:DeoR/GlpR family transcriptional regulator of sugar metabolism
MATIRDKQILDLLCRYGELSVQQLSDVLQVSSSSIRRYLAAMDKSPFLHRTHGGAILSNVLQYGAMTVALPFADEAEVRAIAYRAAQLIEPGDIIGLSGGRFCTELALNLRFREDLTVVTNAINVACELLGLPGIKVMVCGGIIVPNSFELVGQSVSRSLEGIFIHKYFVGTDGITVENGLTNRSEAEATAARDFVAHSDRIIVLADHPKFTRSNLAQVVPAEKISTIITTDRVSESILKGFADIGVKILVSPVDRVNISPLVASA